MALQPDILGKDQHLFKKLQTLVPGVTFRLGEAFSWSPGQATVTYCHHVSAEPMWALLHEAGHATLRHKNYQNDIDLLQKEVAAWDQAKELASQLDITIEEDHIQDCLDTYRDWLHQRSTCPRCGTVSLQTSSSKYQCHNCLASWRVSISRFCRPYRLSKNFQ